MSFGYNFEQMMNFLDDKYTILNKKLHFPAIKYKPRWLTESTYHIWHELRYDGLKFRRFTTITNSNFSSEILSVHATGSDVYWQGVLDTTLCDQVCQWLATGQWFFGYSGLTTINQTLKHNCWGFLILLWGFAMESEKSTSIVKPAFVTTSIKQ